MKIFKVYFKIIVQIIFVIIFFSTAFAKNSEKYNNADKVSDYFSGILLLNEYQYEESSKYLKKLNGLQEIHRGYPIKYLYSSINSGKINEAVKFSKKLEIQNLASYESHLIIGIYYLKKNKFDLAREYFLKAKNGDSRLILNKYVSESLYNWSGLRDSNYLKSSEKIDNSDKRFDNLKKIQKVFLNCYFNNPNTKKSFNELTTSSKVDFSRYNFFYALNTLDAGKLNEAKNIIETSTKLYPRNLLLNQLKIDLRKGKNTNKFNCKKENHVAAEILYITANALSSQSIYSLSNFYLNLAKYLNEEFISFDTLIAENIYKINNLKKAKIIYYDLINKGEAYKWFATKQLARILIEEDEKKAAVRLTEEAYNNFDEKDIYATFDYAEFLKNNELFEKSISLYTYIINKVNKDHPLYSESTDGRGVSYERIGQWDKAEKDLLESLKINPDQAYVINYLAYSWIEQGINIEKSLNMLEKANKLKSNDPYIIDSLGWALFKLKRYQESKSYLQLAVKLMPGDPIVNDHYGDVLWKNGNKLQARYYWEYVLNLKKTEDDLREKIEKKIIKGL